jgi:hypothetical protein
MVFKHRAAAMILSSTLLFFSGVSVDAATLSNSSVTVSAGDVRISSSSTKISGDSSTFAQVLSSSYNRTISPREVIRLRTDFNFGLGDIALVYATAVYSGRTVDEISQLRLKNMGWGEIAKLYGVKVKDLKKGNYEVVNAARERGVDVTYIEINEEQRNLGGHSAVEYQDNSPSDKNGHKKDYKHDNGKGNGHNK